MVNLRQCYPESVILWLLVLGLAVCCCHYQAGSKVISYQVQVGITCQDREAEILKSQVAFDLIIKDRDEVVVIVFDAPYYKVRVGNFEDYESASRFRDWLIESGYGNSWVVRGIWISK